MEERLQAIDNPRDFPCPYRPGQLRNVFVIHAVPAPGPASRGALVSENDRLQNLFLPKGFNPGTLYVMGNDCQACRSCVPLRIRAIDYNFSKNEKHILKHNADLAVSIGPVRISIEHHALFLKYLNRRHPENENNQWKLHDLERHLTLYSHIIELRTEQKKLAGVVVFNLLDSSLSAFQVFYDPDLSDNRHSLGTLCYLEMIKFAQEQQRDHIYIGAWVEGSKKLDYKKRFQNLEALTDQEWLPFDPKAHVTGPDMRTKVPPGTPWITAP